jgi:hypothetical protein
LRACKFADDSPIVQVKSVTGKKEEKVTIEKSGKKTDEVKTTAEVRRLRPPAA